MTPGHENGRMKRLPNATFTLVTTSLIAIGAARFALAGVSARRSFATCTAVFRPVLQNLTVKILTIKPRPMKMRRLIALFFFLLKGPAAQAAAPNECADLFQTSYRMAGAQFAPLDSRLSVVHLESVAELKTDLDRNLLRHFQPHRELLIQVGLGDVDPRFDPFSNIVRFPFSYPTAFFKPKPENADAYYRKHGIQFKTRAVFTHEYTHAVLRAEFVQKIHGYRHALETLGRWKRENRSEAEMLAQLEPNQELLKQMRTYQLVSAYDEFLADLSTAIYFDDPRNPSKGIRKFFWLRSGGHLAAALLSRMEPRDHYRDFDTKYEGDLDLHYPSLATEAHWLLGPTRPATWKMYLKYRKSIPQHVFFRAVVDVVLDEINELMDSEKVFYTFESAMTYTSYKHDVRSLNYRLTKRIEALRFDQRDH